MSQSTRVEGTRVYCHVCEHEWDRSQGGLSCPNCESEFVEIVEHNTRPENDTAEHEDTPPPIPHTSRPEQLPPHPLQTHNPWAPDPDEDDITHFEFNTGGGRGTFSFTSRTYTVGGNGRNMDPLQAEVGRNFESMLGNIMGMHNGRRPGATTSGSIFGALGPQPTRGFGSVHAGPPQDLFSLFFSNPTNATRQVNHPVNPFDFLSAILNPGNAQHGDTVFSQEAFDRVMTQLMEQNQGSNAPGPASQAAINALQRKPVVESMMGSDGKAECSICMDNVEIGNEVTFLPCNHWFHHECIVSWLNEHDTCPHCRQPISNPQDGAQRTGSSRRRPSRRSSSVASPFRSSADPTQRIPSVVDTPSGMREARQQYYGTRRGSSRSSHSHEQQSTTSRDRNSDGGGGGGGVGEWIRNHMPFS